MAPSSEPRSRRSVRFDAPIEAWFGPDAGRRSVLDRAHQGDIEGGLGGVAASDTGPRRTTRRRLATLAAVLGPGVIVMVADNDAGSLATFAQAGQDYGVRLIWLLALLSAGLFVAQEMVARLGAVTGAGHARLIYERFGPRWGRFAVADLLALNVLTVMTEFIGLQLGLGYFGVSRFIVVPAGALALLAMSTTGSFRRWERSMWVLVGASLMALPLLLVAGGHRGGGGPPTAGATPTGSGVLFVVGMVGTTVAPWQLFFQQSNVVDKRITTRWLRYERIDTAVGTLVFFAAALAVIVACANAFHLSPLHGRFVDGGQVARGLRHQVGAWAGALFAIALIDGSLLGAGAVSLSSSYALGDVRGTRHSLHRRWGDARTFYGTYAATLSAAAVTVLLLDGSLGAVTLAIQALSGALFPSAAVFLLLLANDREVLGPHVNPVWLNVAAVTALAAVLVLSSVLDLTTAFPHLQALPLAIVIGVAAGLVAAGWLAPRRGEPRAVSAGAVSAGAGSARAGSARAGSARAGSARAGSARAGSAGGPSPAGRDRRTWTMPPIETLGRASMSRARTVGLVALRTYLAVTAASILVRLARMVAG